MPSALSNQAGSNPGRTVDWWFMYKVPTDVGPTGDSTGYEYYYFDDTSSASDPHALAPFTLDTDGSALQQTLAQLFDTDDENIGYIIWNDELPEGVDGDYIYSDDSSAYGHTKGILGFDKSTGTAFYLLHSTPKFPAVGQPHIPEGQNKYGQTFLCVSLTYAAANDIAEVLRLHHRPQVYASRLPGVTSDESLHDLVENSSFPSPSKVPAAVDLTSVGGAHFRFFGKSRKWSEKVDDDDTTAKDFWADLVGPSLRSDLNVETWRNGTPLVFADEEDDPTTGEATGDETLDVLVLDFGKLGIPGYTWAYTKDHAKWGISVDDVDGWVIVADLNRQVSQADRGGGGMAFQHDALWSLLQAVEVPESEADNALHKDEAPDLD